MQVRRGAGVQAGAGAAPGCFEFSFQYGVHASTGYAADLGQGVQIFHCCDAIQWDLIFSAGVLGDNGGLLYRKGNRRAF